VTVLELLDVLLRVYFAIEVRILGLRLGCVARAPRLLVWFMAALLLKPVTTADTFATK